ncbi:DUF3726 domain-containing protein [Pacificoceanicola onchidii]|uniref:DUF3726 domain-containing protein n=1 Tax=Pacificoceanicola onchidii TaxID=2562685 RepID=UPI0010A3D4D0|nr:DUF3726 domain-containing protein [Pacificoceanicola onchidii]
MTFALIEVEAMAKKAARGAGYGWGMAEEAAKATRALCAVGLDGVAALAAALTSVDGKNLSEVRPSTLSGDWRGETGALCPVSTGAALSDSVQIWAKEGKRITNINVPVLLVPFAMNAARHHGQTVTLTWGGSQVVTDGSSVDVSLDHEYKENEIADMATVRVGGQLTSPSASHFRSAPAADDWKTLCDLAQRTYAPDTEESRRKGAGAGLTDND